MKNFQINKLPSSYSLIATQFNILPMLFCSNLPVLLIFSITEMKNGISNERGVEKTADCF